MKILATGGCINKQKDLPLRKHYHFILRDMIKEKTGQYPDMHLETYYNYFDISERIKESVQAKPDVLIFFIRPFPLHPLIKPLVRFKHHKEEVQTILHPRFNKANIARQTGTMTQHELQANGGSKSIFHKIFAQANISAGKILGLDKWALDYVSDEILKINSSCHDTGTKLILAGPPLYPAYGPLDTFCSQLNVHIKKLAAAHAISHADIAQTHDERHQPIFEPDGYHMSAAGHTLLATSIIKHIPLC